MFDPSGRPGLSEEAAALEPAALAAQARIAERLLRVDPLAYDSLDAESQEAWADMVVLQIGYQLQANLALSHQSIGDLQQSFRAGGPVSPDARIIRDAFFADGTSGGSWGIDGVFDSNE